MRTEILPVLVVTLWAATSPGSSFNEEASPFLDKIVTPTTSFAMELMKHLVSESANKNIIISPLSASTVMAMVQQGAKEESAAQLGSVLNLSSEDAKRGYQTLITRLRNRQSKAILKFSNGIFLNQNFDLLLDFRQSMSENFLASVDKVDFNQPEVAARKINTQVSNMTKGLIDSIVSPDMISGRLEMVLTNAVYFKGQWTYPFSENDTVKAPFFKDEEHPPVQVNMMSLSQDLRAGEEKKSLKAKWVELPYEYYEYSMIVVLPDDNVDALIRRMGPANLKYLATTTSTREVKLKMPKFSLETYLSLVPALKSMGIQDIFSQNSNLEGISLTKRPLLVSGVLHKARIEVNENGSEAAAASAVFVNTLSLTPDYEDLEIILNRPFLAILLDRHSKLPIFMAKVYNPTTS